MATITTMHLQPETITVRNKASIINSLQTVKKIAQKIGFNTYDQNRIETAVSEIAENAVKYAGKGTIEIHTLDHGLEIICKDTGKGMMQKNTTPGLGIGLKIVEHTMDELHIETNNHGTCIKIKKWLK